MISIETSGIFAQNALFQSTLGSSLQTQTTKNYASSAYQGVYLQNKKWVARIKIGKKIKYLGRFSQEIDAARACKN